MTKTITLTIRDKNGHCLESKVGTATELDEFLLEQGYPFILAEIPTGGTVEDDDGQTFQIAL